MSHSTSVQLLLQQEARDPFEQIKETRWFVAQSINPLVNFTRMVHICRRVSIDEMQYNMPEVVYIDISNGVLSYSSYDYLIKNYKPVPGDHSLSIYISQ